MAEFVSWGVSSKLVAASNKSAASILRVEYLSYFYF
jgi:hypothetical protein